MVAIIAEMERDPGDVSVDTSKEPPFKEHVVPSHLTSSVGKLVCVYEWDPCCYFHIIKEEGNLQRGSKIMKVHIFFSPKETRSISTAIFSDAADFMLQRTENEYLAVSTKSVCDD